jgi:electron transport complex protein RnfG
MKKRIIALTSVLLVLAIISVIFICATTGDKVMTKEKGVYIVNTTTLTQDVQGYNGPTPLKIYIKDDKIQKIEALPNDETPNFFERVKANMLNKWNGMTVKAAATANVDVVTGATYSSNAVKANVKAGINYYQKHKK